MYRITFKGQIDPAYVPDEKGQKIYQDWLHNTMPEKIEIENGRAILSNTIRAVEANHNAPSHSDAEMDANKRTLTEEETNYIGNRFTIANLPAEEKAKRMGIPEMVWWAVTGKKEIPDDLVKQVEERQLGYFQKNPRRAFADPVSYKDLMVFNEGERPQIERKENLKRIDHHGRIGIMSFVERVLQKDHYNANRE